MSALNFFNLMLLAALWGGSFMFMRIASPEFGPIALIAVRVFVASCLIVPVWFLRTAKDKRIEVRQNWQNLFIVGLLNSAIPFVLFAYSSLHITGGFASILNSTVPIWAALVAWMWIHKIPSFSEGMGLGLGLAGVVVLVSPNISLNFDGTTMGILAASMAALIYGIAANFVSQKLPHTSALTIATFSLVAASIMLTPLALIYLPSEPISVKAWASVIAMGLFSTAFANILYFNLLKEIGSTKAVTVTFLIPVFGTLWGVLFINEELTLEMVLGSIVILMGTALVTNLVRLPQKQAG